MTTFDLPIRWLILASIFTGVSCGVGLAQSESSETTEATKNPVVKRLQVFDDPIALRFELSDADGVPVSHRDVIGKVAVICLFTSQSNDCREQLAMVNRLQKEMGDKRLRVLGIGFEVTRDPMVAADRVFDIREELELTFPCAVGDATVRRQLPRLRSYPVILVLDSRAHVRFILKGKQQLKTLKQTVDIVAGSPR